MTMALSTAPIDNTIDKNERFCQKIDSLIMIKLINHLTQRRLNSDNNKQFISL